MENTVPPSFDLVPRKLAAAPRLIQTTLTALRIHFVVLSLQVLYHATHLDGIKPNMAEQGHCHHALCSLVVLQQL